MTTANATFPTPITDAILAKPVEDEMPASRSNSGDVELSEDPRWVSVLARDHARDGEFVFAVATTGVYCRPSCPSRRPRRENVKFYSHPEQAEKAGFRA